MEKDRFIDMWETMVDMGIATDEEIGLVVAINGRTIQTLEMILYVRTAETDISALFEEEEEE
jgi:hypothetical protein